MFGFGGCGFRGCTPPWPYVGRGRGGLPRCAWPGFWGAPGYGEGFSREHELRFLKHQAEMLRRELDGIEARIRELEKEQ
ncbi:MAG: DUF5320 domain-containing protein [Candidatus Caldatribacteriaceae bacterium]